MAKTVAKKTKVTFGKKKAGKAKKHPNKRMDTKIYKGQGR